MGRRRGGLVRGSMLGLLLVAAAQGVVVDSVSAEPSPVARAAGAVDCTRPAKGFVPTVAQLPSLNTTVRVIQVKRTSNGAVGAGPVTDEGKWLMAMDPQTKPASRKGSVLMSGHTWPDGSALGNAMLRNLQKGNRVILYGKNGKRACYQVSERASYPANQVPQNKAFRYWGPEQLVIVACSGKRLGPGNWTRRTVWYATPVLPAKAAPPKSDPPPADQPNLLGGILGGLLGGGG